MRIPLLLLGCALLTVACSPSEWQRTRIATNARDVELCCEPSDDLPITAGEFLVQVYAGQFGDLDPATLQAVFTWSAHRQEQVAGPQHLPASDAVRLSLPSGSSLALGSNAIEVLIDHCDYWQYRIDFIVEVVGRRLDDQSLEVTQFRDSFDVTNLCPPSPDATLPEQIIAETIVGAELRGFDDYWMDAPYGVETDNPDPAVPPQVPEDIAEVFHLGAFVTDLDEQQLSDAFTGPAPVFPLGVGPEGLTLESTTPEPMSPGRYLLAWLCVAAHIPAASPQEFMEFSLFLDRDGNSSNNFAADEPETLNPRDDTDSWYELDHVPSGRWSLSTTDAQTIVEPNQPTALPSSARVILQGQVVFFVIPVSELNYPGATPARFSTFIHRGDRGQDLPWSADPTPPVGQPRLSLNLR